MLENEDLRKLALEQQNGKSFAFRYIMSENGGTQKISIVMVIINIKY